LAAGNSIVSDTVNDLTTSVLSVTPVIQTLTTWPNHASELVG